MSDIKDMAKRGVAGAVASTAAALPPDVVASLVLNGDLSKLTDTQRVAYYNTLCERVGLDPATQPFKLLKLDGKLVMYADKGATQQLSDNRKISHQITGKQTVEDVFVVTVRATMPDGRYTDEDGVVSLTGYRDGKEYRLKGKELANAMMRATTKAKRRAVLALLGLAIMDETEIDTVEGEKVIMPPPAPQVDTGKEVKAEIRVEPQKADPVMTPGRSWLQTARDVIPTLAEKGDKAKVKEWWAEGLKRRDTGELTEDDLANLKSMILKFFPPNPAPQPALFNNQGEPTPEPAPEKPEPKKRAAKKASGVDLSDAIDAAEKLSALFTLKSKIEKAELTDTERETLLKKLNDKMSTIKGASK